MKSDVPSLLQGYQNPETYDTGGTPSHQVWQHSSQFDFNETRLENNWDWMLLLIRHLQKLMSYHNARYITNSRNIAPPSISGTCDCIWENVYIFLLTPYQHTLHCRLPTTTAYLDLRQPQFTGCIHEKASRKRKKACTLWFANTLRIHRICQFPRSFSWTCPAFEGFGHQTFSCVTGCQETYCQEI